MSIAVARGPQADQLEADPAWASKWTDLVRSCAFATPFLHTDFLAAWRGIDRAERALAYELDGSGALLGAFPIVKAGDRWCGWGAGYALRHGWLARPLLGSYFAERAALALHRQLPDAVIHLDDLPDDAPVDWTSRRRASGRVVRMESTEAPRIELDGDEMARPLDKRANSAQLKALEKLGRIQREDGLDDDAWSKVFDWWDGHAVATSRPVRYTPERRRLVREVAPLTVVSALYLTPKKKGAARELVSAIVGYPYGAHFDLECIAEAPDFEQWSAAYLHWLMLEPELYARGVRHVGAMDMPAWVGWLGAPQGRAHVRLLGPAARRLRHDAADRLVGLGKWALGRLER